MILTAKSTSDLEIRVLSLLAYGWEPLGVVVVKPVPRDVNEYMQTMVKREDKVS
jgi:hypothetical protein